MNDLVEKAEKAFEESSKDSLADKLVEEVENSDALLFHDDFGDSYVAIHGNGKLVFKLPSKGFQRWLARHVWDELRKAPPREAIKTAIRVLEGKALFDGPCCELHVRLTQFEDAIWYDLGNGTAIQIDTSGWRIIDEPPILFKSFPHQVSQVLPTKNGSLERLCDFFNLEDEKDRLLIQIYTVAAFIPGFPHPILVFYGPQGSGKTTPHRLLKSLIDPSILKTLSAPDKLPEFVQLASHHQFLFLDNLSSLPGWLSDALARACTGDGFSKRELYSNDEDFIYCFQRTIALNGINLVVQKADLLDRSILVGLKHIPKEKRLVEKELLKKFEQEKPAILGAIFDTVPKALSEYPKVSLPEYPRMADFTRWGCAIARALGYQDRDFLSAYLANVTEQNEAALEASPVGTAIIAFIEDNNPWKGTATELLTKLELLSEKLKININSKYWPKDPARLSKKIQLVESNLAEQGIEVIRDDKARPRVIEILKTSKNTDGTDGSVGAKPGVPSKPDGADASDSKSEQSDQGWPK